MVGMDDNEVGTSPRDTEERERIERDIWRAQVADIMPPTIAIVMIILDIKVIVNKTVMLMFHLLGIVGVLLIIY